VRDCEKRREGGQGWKCETAVTYAVTTSYTGLTSAVSCKKLQEHCWCRGSKEIGQLKCDIDSQSLKKMDS